MAAINHNVGAQRGLAHFRFTLLNVSRLVVRLASPTEYDVAMWVAGRTKCRHLALLRNTDEGIDRRSSSNRVDSHRDVTIHVILESDGGGNTAGQLSMSRGFGCTGTYCCPADQVLQVLGGD